MPRTGLWLRVFVGLLLAVLPPILLVVAAVLLASSVLSDADPNLIAIVVVVATIVWAAILAVLYTRVVSDELSSMVSLAERGEAAVAPEISPSHQQLAGTLEERNRQVASLAQEASRIPIDAEPETVVRALVSMVRSVMQDATWRAAILSTSDEGLLQAGVYLGSSDDRDVGAIGDLEQWASVTQSDEPAVRVEGPWGAFAVAHITVADRVRGILYAPWEGRPAPTPAELAVLRLVGQHVGTALEHSLLYAQVRAQGKELERLSRIQADFLRGVTHDLQTPLTSIAALATELRAEAGVPPSAQVDLATISHQAERLRRMVSQLLVASRLEAGVLTPQSEIFAVPPLVERTWSALRAERPFELQVEGPPHLAVGDPDRLEQVLWALLDNAVKYSPSGAPIVVRVEPKDGHICVSIRDQGIGMEAEERDRAFDQFYRSPHARQLAPDGSGIGLYAARGLVTAMGGSIAVDSTLGRGTTVTLHLPSEPAEVAD